MKWVLLHDHNHYCIRVCCEWFICVCIATLSILALNFFVSYDNVKSQTKSERIRHRPHSGFVCFDSCLGSTLTIINWFVLTSLRFLCSFYFLSFVHPFFFPLYCPYYILLAFFSLSLPPSVIYLSMYLTLSCLAYYYMWMCVCVRTYIDIAAADSSVWLSSKRQIVAIFQWIPKIWCNLKKIYSTHQPLSLSPWPTNRLTGRPNHHGSNIKSLTRDYSCSLFYYINGNMVNISVGCVGLGE